MEKIWKICIKSFNADNTDLSLSKMTLEEALLVAKANNFKNLKWNSGVAEDKTKTHSCMIFISTLDMEN